MPRPKKSPANKDWTEETSIKFIREYKEYRVLWDPNHINYMHKGERLLAMSALGEKYNLSTEGLKNKIKCLRSYYIKERRKLIFKSLDDGKIYEPKWFAFKELSFLSDVVSKQDEIPENVRFEMETSTTNNEIQEISDSSGSESCEEEDENPAKKFKFEVIPIETVTVESTQDFPSRSYENSSNKERNDFDIFGEHVAAQLKTLTLPHAIAVQGHIQKYLNKCRLDHYNTKES